METNKIRRVVFWPLTCLTLIVLAVTEYYDWPDTCLLMYGGIACFSLLSSAIFSWWWFCKRGATGIYKWLTFVMAGIGYTHCFQFVARWAYLYDPKWSKAILESNLWQYRNLPQIIAMIFMLAFIFGQILGEDEE